eukprot:4016375-Ditylum_brightwellii.AAC.1
MHVFYLANQKEGMTLEAYLDEFTNRKDMVEQCGGCAGSHPGLTDNALRERGLDPDDPDNYSSDELEKAQRDAKEAYLAFVFLFNANKTKFAPLSRELANSYLQGNYDYPCTISKAHKLL